MPDNKHDPDTDPSNPERACTPEQLTRIFQRMESFFMFESADPLETEIDLALEDELVAQGEALLPLVYHMPVSPAHFRGEEAAPWNQFDALSISLKISEGHETQQPPLARLFFDFSRPVADPAGEVAVYEKSVAVTSHPDGSNELEVRERVGEDEQVQRSTSAADEQVVTWQEAEALLRLEHNIIQDFYAG